MTQVSSGLQAAPREATTARETTAALVVTGVGVTLPGVDDPRRADRPEPAAQGWFDVGAELGPHGYKYLPPACQYLVSASRRALASAAEHGGLTPEAMVVGERRAAAVGTNSAAASLHARMDSTITEAGARDLSPATAPYFSINLFGSRLAVEHGLKGFNLTFVSPRTAGFEAVEAGTRALRLGRADLLLAGATEAGLPEAAPDGTPDEDGAVVVVLEPWAQVAARDVTPLATCRALTLYLAPSRLGRLGGAEQAAAEVRAAVGRLAGDEVPPARAVVGDDAISAALVAGLRASGAEVTTAQAGAGCLAPLRHLAALVATSEGDHLVATAAAEGHVGLALVRRTAPTREAA